MDLLLERALDVAAWCDRQAKSSGASASLRSPELQPISADPYRYGLMTGGNQIIDKIAAKRRFLLQSTGMSLEKHLHYLNEGRFLVYQPDASFADALAEDQSEGFFDKWDAPPWDTWIWYEAQGGICDLPSGTVQEGVLLSWIPRSMLRFAQSGVDIQPYGAVKWLDDTSLFLNGLP